MKRPNEYPVLMETLLIANGALRYLGLAVALKLPKKNERKAQAPW
jgi:hypothetical protein